MKLLARLGLAILIVAATYFAILRIAEHKADALAGRDTFRLDAAHPSAMRSFDEVIDQLRRWKQTDLAESLIALREKGHLWIAPHLGGNRSAIFVSALGLVRRIYVRNDVADGELPFPDLNVPEAAQRQFARIRLAGTLFHELQHHNGLEDETATYDREVEWYRSLRQDVLPGLAGEAARLFEWAVDSAIESALAAREKATSAAAPSSAASTRSRVRGDAHRAAATCFREGDGSLDRTA